MTIKDRYQKAGFKSITVKPRTFGRQSIVYDIFISAIPLSGTWATEVEAWEWVEKNFPLPDIEAIKKKWQKRLKPIESNAVTATAQQIEINKRQQEIGYQKAVKEILSDLGEK